MGRTLISNATFSAPIPPTKRDHGIPTEDFSDQCFDVGKEFSIRKCWEPVGAYHAVELFLRFALGLRIERHSKEE